MKPDDWKGNWEPNPDCPLKVSNDPDGSVYPLPSLGSDSRGGHWMQPDGIDILYPPNNLFPPEAGYPVTRGLIDCVMADGEGGVGFDFISYKAFKYYADRFFAVLNPGHPLDFDDSEIANYQQQQTYIRDHAKAQKEKRKAETKEPDA